MSDCIGKVLVYGIANVVVVVEDANIMTMLRWVAVGLW